MLNDTIQTVPDGYAGLGAQARTFRYNGFEFTLKAESHPMARTTNEWAKELMELNIEANIRKSVKGLGHGQYMEPADVRRLQNGEITMHARVGGKFYKVPISVSPSGDYSVPVIRRKFSSLRDVAASVMEGIMMENGIDNVYSHGSGLAARNAARGNTHAAPTIRM